MAALTNGKMRCARRGLPAMAQSFSRFSSFQREVLSWATSGVGLRLLAGAWLLAGAGCTKDQTPGPEQAQELVAEPALEPVVIAGGTPEFQTLADQAMRLWQRDIEEYRRLTKDPPALRRQAEEFMRTVQLGMLPQVYGPGHAKTAQMGERLFEQGCRDPLLKSYYGRAVCCAEGAYESMPLCVESLNAWEQSGYPGVYRRMAVFTLFAEAKLYARSLDWPRLRGEAASLAACRVATTIAPQSAAWCLRVAAAAGR